MITNADAHNTMRASDYVRYYNLEPYLFTTVHKRFQRQHELGAFDFMSIVVWKANRAKSQVAKRLLTRTRGREDLDAVTAPVSERCAPRLPQLTQRAKKAGSGLPGHR